MPTEYEDDEFYTPAPAVPVRPVETVPVVTETTTYDTTRVVEDETPWLLWILGATAALILLVLALLYVVDDDDDDTTVIRPETGTTAPAPVVVPPAQQAPPVIVPPAQQPPVIVPPAQQPPVIINNPPPQQAPQQSAPAQSPAQSPAPAATAS